MENAWMNNKKDFYYISVCLMKKKQLNFIFQTKPTESLFFLLQNADNIIQLYKFHNKKWYTNITSQCTNGKSKCLANRNKLLHIFFILHFFNSGKVEKREITLCTEKNVNLFYIQVCTKKRKEERKKAAATSSSLYTKKNEEKSGTRLKIGW